MKDINKWIDLSVLPKYEDGRFKGKYDWTNSVNCQLDYHYNGVVGVLTIKSFVKEEQKLTVEVNNRISELHVNNLIRCRLKTVLGFKISEYRLNVGDVLDVKSGQIEIQDRFKENGYKKYRYKCMNPECEYIGTTNESHLLSSNKGCKRCAKTLKYTAEQFENYVKNETYEEYIPLEPYTGSHDKILMKHNDCQRTWSVSPTDFKAGTRCPYCTSEYRYSQMHIALLEFLKSKCSSVEGEYDIGFRGSKGGVSKYDIYDPSSNTLYECQSEYHDDKEEHDKRKREYAIAKGYNFTSLDCRECSPLAAIQSIDSSVLKLPNINWNKYRSWDIALAQDLLDTGIKIIDIPNHIDVSEHAIRSAIRDGRLIKPLNYKIKSTFIYNWNDIQSELYNGLSVAEIPKKIGVSKVTIYENIRKGLISKPKYYK